MPRTDRRNQGYDLEVKRPESRHSVLRLKDREKSRMIQISGLSIWKDGQTVVPFTEINKAIEAV